MKSLISDIIVIAMAVVPIAAMGATQQEGTYAPQGVVRTGGTVQGNQSQSNYYRNRQAAFQKKADDEKRELDRRSQNVSGPAAKPPRPVDTARNLYQYYLDEAKRMGQMADRYEAQGALTASKQ